jgi:hypothetical protein
VEGGGPTPNLDLGASDRQDLEDSRSIYCMLSLLRTSYMQRLSSLSAARIYG